MAFVGEKRTSIEIGSIVMKTIEGWQFRFPLQFGLFKPMQPPLLLGEHFPLGDSFCDSLERSKVVIEEGSTIPLPTLCSVASRWRIEPHWFLPVHVRSHPHQFVLRNRWLSIPMDSCWYTETFLWKCNKFPTIWLTNSTRSPIVALYTRIVSVQSSWIPSRLKLQEYNRPALSFVAEA